MTVNALLAAGWTVADILQMILNRCSLLAVALFALPANIDAQTTVIENVNIVDVTNGRLQPRKTIVIEGKDKTREQITLKVPVKPLTFAGPAAGPSRHH